MGFKTECEVLKHIPILAGLTESQRKLLSFTSELVSHGPGEEILKENEIGDTAYILISGAVEVVRNINGEDKVVATISQNQIFGEIALLHRGKRTATIRAANDVKCLVISKEVFYVLLKENSDFALHVMKYLAARLVETLERTK